MFISITQARERGASRWLQGKMLRNLALDAALGAVPLAGDVFDIYFRAHRRNLKLLQDHLGEPYKDGRDTDTPLFGAYAPNAVVAARWR